MNIKNYKDSAWYLSIILKVLAIVLLFSTGKIGYEYLAHSTISDLSTSQSATTTLLSLGHDVNNSISSTINTSVRVTMSFLTAIFLIVILLIASSYFNKISKDTSPFNKHQIKKLNIIAITTLIFSLIKPIIYSILISILSKRGFFYYELDSLFIIALILIVTVSVFKYGAELQKSYDETV